jgi:hypothetical protein
VANGGCVGFVWLVWLNADIENKQSIAGSRAGREWEVRMVAGQCTETIDGMRTARAVLARTEAGSDCGLVSIRHKKWPHFWGHISRGFDRWASGKAMHADPPSETAIRESTKSVEESEGHVESASLIA